MNNNQSISYAADLPYPPIQVANPNLNYARAMLDNMASSNSEMSAVSLYFYNQLVSQQNQEISNAFAHIGNIEMHHLAIFGELARQLGEDPKLWAQCGPRKVFWTPAYNQYTCNIQKLLINAINGEKAAIKKYESQSEKIDDDNIVENLKRIIMDEQLHVKILGGLYQKYF